MRILLVAIFTISLLLSEAQTVNHFDSSFFEKQEFAHRGGYANGFENTIETIIYTLQNHSQAIEVDVQMTRDNQLVLFHDKTIKRVLEGNQDKKVSDLTLAELSAIPFTNSDGHPVFVSSLKALADTLASLVSNGTSLNLIVELDFKLHEDQLLEPAVNELINILSEKESELGDVIYNHFFVSSFYPQVLKSIREKSQKIKTAFAVHNNPDHNKLKGKAGVLFAKMVLRKYDVQILEPNICLVTKRFVEKWHKRDILINTYTANTECQKGYLKSLNIAITSNCPKSTCYAEESDQMTKAKKWCKSCR